MPDIELEGLKVLIVDDNATNRKILSHQTASWKLIPSEAEDGERALALLRAAAARNAPYDVVLMDLHMPGMTGFELARTIKADPDIARVPLVLMPSFAQRGDGELAREIGIAAYLTKPVRQSQLFDCLVTVLNRSGVAASQSNAPAVTKLVTQHTLKEQDIMSRRLVLVAEDNIVNQKVAVRQLQTLGYRADVVANGLEALEALTRISYDLVLMDCQMPEMDGYEATAAIRLREGQSKHTLIIAMTANAMEGDREKCLAAGMDDYVGKPVKPAELQKVLERWLSGQPQVAAASDGAASAHDSPVVDMKRLRGSAGGDEDLLRELVDLALNQLTESIEKLRAALDAKAADQVHRIAHTSVGGSAVCGLVAVVVPLRKLERMGQEGHLDGAAEMVAELEKAFEQTKLFFKSH